MRHSTPPETLVLELIIAVGANDAKTLTYFLAQDHYRKVINEAIDYNRGNHTVLQCAVASGKVAMIEALVESGADVNTPNKDGDTPVRTAAIHGQVEALQVLAKLGADINTPNKNGWTPVYTALLTGHMAALRVLAELGADVNTPNKNGATPVCIVAYEGYGQVEMLRVLLDLGADATVPYQGWTPLEIAQQRKHQDIVALLAAHLKQYPNGIKPVTPRLSTTHATTTQPDASPSHNTQPKQAQLEPDEQLSTQSSQQSTEILKDQTVKQSTSSTAQESSFSSSNIPLPEDLVLTVEEQRRMRELLAKAPEWVDRQALAEVVRREEVSYALCMNESQEREVLERDYIRQHQTLFEYYQLFRSTLSRTFVAAMAISSDLIDPDNTTKFVNTSAKAAKWVGNLIEGIGRELPGLKTATQLLNALVQSGLKIHAQKQLANLVSYAADVTSFEAMSEQLARYLTIGLRYELLELKVVPEGVIQKFLKNCRDLVLSREADTPVKEQALGDATAVLKLLLEGAVEINSEESLVEQLAYQLIEFPRVLAKSLTPEEYAEEFRESTSETVSRTSTSTTVTVTASAGFFAPSSLPISAGEFQEVKQRLAQLEEEKSREAQYAHREGVEKKFSEYEKKLNRIHPQAFLPDGEAGGEGGLVTVKDFEAPSAKAMAGFSAFRVNVQQLEAGVTMSSQKMAEHDEDLEALKNEVAAIKSQQKTQKQRSFFRFKK